LHGTLFDHFIRLREKRRRKRKAKLLRRLQVDDQVELRGLLYGKIRRPAQVPQQKASKAIVARTLARELNQ